MTASASQARRAALGSFLGAVVEWYDFLLYGIVAALAFNTAFFPETSSQAGTLAAFATFGVGFLFRPLGGVIFGYFGDRLGRRRMLVWTVSLMGVATAAIGLLPTYDTIGWWAPLLLVILRMVQGVAVGGEWGGASLMAVESAPRGLKAFFSSGVQVGYSVALILATAFTSAMTAIVGNDAFIAWGWRIPFFVSALLVGVALWVRSGVEETEVFRSVVATHQEKRRGGPLVAALREHPQAFLQIIALRLGELFTMYIVTAFALSYATDQLEFSRSFMLNVGLTVGAIGIVTIPLFAWLSDRYGRRVVYLTGAAVGTLSAVPFFLALQSGSMALVIVCAVLLVNVAHDAIVSVQQPLFAEMFNAQHRYSGAGVAYQVASMLAGGFTPFIATGLVALSGGSWHGVAAYLAGGCLLSLCTMLFFHRPTTRSEHPSSALTPAQSQ